MHKFHLGQSVEFNPPRGIYAPRGPYVVTAKLPEKDGEFEYRVRGAGEAHERLARENELSTIALEDKPMEAGSNKKLRLRELKRSTYLSFISKKKKQRSSGDPRPTSGFQNR